MRLCLILLLTLCLPVQARPQRLVLPLRGSRQLVVDVLTDSLLHCEITERSPGEIATTYVPADQLKRYPGSRSFKASLVLSPSPPGSVWTAQGLKTGQLELRVSGDQLQLFHQGQLVLTLEPGLLLDCPRARQLYGLGEQLLPQRAGQTDGDWLGQVRYFGADEEHEHPFGNCLVKYLGGDVANASFPVLYALGTPSCMFFLDTPYKQRWDFRQHPFRLTTPDPDCRFFLAVGQDLRDLRRTYMGLVGRPPVPPRRAFGLWVSRYGFENWGQLLDRLKTLRANRFPVDGFVLDLQWFGGIQANSETSRMGSLSFDESHFPHPADMIRRLREHDGVGVIPIEEPFVCKGLPEFQVMASRGYLALSGSQPQIVNEGPWWGIGGLLDYSSPATCLFWHNLKRQPLIELGVAGHWTDLGEPEACLHKAEDGTLTPPTYAGGDEARVHNLYAWHWAEGIARGYRENHVRQRPFILGRTGGPGIQRFGVALWSGDIGANSQSLAAHYNSQMHMAMSGIDYLGSDIGGFHREAFHGTPQEYRQLYTHWFADACATDVPVRPHAHISDKAMETSPDRVGDPLSNRANLRWRYQLLPYYYSLAHRAAESGDPLVAPPAYWFPEMAALGGLKLIGPDLLVALSVEEHQQGLNVTLPPGDWWDMRHPSWHRGPSHFELQNGGVLQLPYLLAAGAVLPTMVVDEQTMNTSGRRLDGSQNTDLVVKACAGPAHTFTLVEDDGESVSPDQARTTLTQDTRGQRTRVTVGATQGHYAGAPERRVTVLDLALPQGCRPRAVRLGGRPVPYREEAGRVVVRTPALELSQPKQFSVDLAPPVKAHGGGSGREGG